MDYWGVQVTHEGMNMSNTATMLRNTERELDLALADARDRAIRDDERMVSELVELAEDMIAEHGLPYKHVERLDVIVGRAGSEQR